jgi:hypothetical protein
VKPTPRWGPLPWFVLVLTLLVILLVVLLPPLILDDEPPAWVLRSAARVASYHGDPDPIEGEWLETTRAEAVRIMESSAVEPSPSPSVSPAESGDAAGVATPSGSPSPTASPIEEPGRAVHVVIMRGRFDSAPPGGPPPPDAPERWLVVAYDDLTHQRWRLVVLDAPPVLPDDAASFEL